MNNDVLDFENVQLRYCEKHGIIESTLKGTKMIYYASYPTYQKEERHTYKVIVDLVLFKEIERKKLSRYNKKGDSNMYL